MSFTLQCIHKYIFNIIHRHLWVFVQGPLSYADFFSSYPSNGSSCTHSHAKFSCSSYKILKQFPVFWSGHGCHGCMGPKEMNLASHSNQCPSQATLVFLAFADAMLPSSILTLRPLPWATTFGVRTWRERTGAEVDLGGGLPDAEVTAVVGRLLKPMVVFGRLCCLLEPTE